MHFERGADQPFPEPIPRPGVSEDDPQPAITWETASLDDLIPQNVRDMLKGG